MYFTFYDYDESVLKIKSINPALDTTIAIEVDNEVLYKIDYVEIDCVISLQDLIVIYYEINSILEKYCNDYEILNEKEWVKKLNLKYIEK